MLSDRPQDVSNHIEEGAGSPEKSQKRLNVDEKKRPNIKVKGRDLSHDVTSAVTCSTLTYNCDDLFQMEREKLYAECEQFFQDCSPPQDLANTVKHVEDFISRQQADHRPIALITV